ncbi:Acyl-lipid (9-3)-desaturase [Zea mays]|uniref:Desaturase/cytochrome b5 protein n=2 Tax=Zea mays TaxID=4577 RepID=B6TV08_MAIZE|nr:desaturase/cytochrome b5 protein [Zea mays]PWZ41813.1 Acyl-lipid (9-3)-desaturase [Zea mays]
MPPSADAMPAPGDAACAGDVRLISSKELREHASAADLWISISGDVYDVTPWLPHHPGGDLPLITLAGQDATDAFAAYHPPSARPLLRRFFVGRLSDYTVSPASADYRRLLAQLSSAGLFERVGPTPRVQLALMAVLFYAALYLVLACASASAHMLAGGLIGFVWIQSGWMGHDSGHHRITGHPLLDRVVQVLSGNCLTGLSIAWWKCNHNTHHIACNSLDHDPDLQHMPLFAVSPKLFGNIWSYFYQRTLAFDAASKFLISYQHWTFYPVMCIARINLLAQSAVFVLTEKRVPQRLLEIAGVAAFWAWYPLLVACLPNWWERVAFVLLSFTFCGIQHVQFCLNHFSSDVYVGPPKGNDWFEKQTAGTLDILCPPWMDWFHGGLQFQIEHHLFPRLPRCHLRKVAPAVRDLCKKHGLTYSAASFLDANVLTWKTLRAAALQARSATGGGGAPKNLVWEALNTHG